ncbi:dynein light chain Tctex-type 5-like [Mytilus edulis]|uniref:Uncharacterized protein n=1 Tax=Mytilus edulis TaxID=6550 RepID=A0A8S3T6A7_MYTED|nr:unnamed protein product [Mytilus edulis]
MDKAYLQRPTARAAQLRAATKSQTPSGRRDDESNCRSETTDELNKFKWENTYKMDPDNLLSENTIQGTMRQAIKELIAGEDDDFLESEGRGHLCAKLTDDIKHRIKTEYANTRYRFIIHVTIVQDFATFSIGSRCLWNDNTDNHMTVSIPFGDSYIVSTCYAVYFE